jgi:hypothetical protein
MKSFLVKFLLFAILLAVALFAFYKIDINKEKSVVFSIDSGTNKKVSILEYGSNQLFADADFFNKAKDKLQSEKTDFIVADLSEMKVRVYIKGEVAIEVPIKTKGREGSWWETPAGIYKIQSRSENHFSSFGNVFQPYSLAFEGNFFIHGWPYYPDGTPVESTFSGGCIRLEDEYAKQIFDIAHVGMPILVFEKDFESDNFQYSMPSPNISAQNYLIADLKSNFVLAEKDSLSQFSVGSISRLLTALVAGEYINLDKDLVIPEGVISPDENSLFLGGNIVSAYNLLFPLLLHSANEPAAAFTEKLGEKRFITLMNDKTVSVGMSATKFVDSSGESPENISNAQDLFLLLKYLYNNRSFILKISSGNLGQSAYGSSVFNDLFKDHLLYENEEFIGGHIDMLNTEAGASAAVIFELEFKNEKRPVAFILNNSQDLLADIEIMKEYINRFYH